MTTATMTRGQAPQTELDAASVDRVEPFRGGRGGRPEIREATSADGLWHYLRVEDGDTPWRVEYLPTGQVTVFGSLPAGRRWTASPAALQHLRAEAADVVKAGGRQSTIITKLIEGRLQRVEEDPDVIAARLGRAARVLAVLDGRLVAVEQPDSRCTCGLPLAELVEPGRPPISRWVHVDACRECIDDQLNGRRSCHTLQDHAPCADADPVLCGHGCPVPTTPAPRCGRGHDACCGCCGDE